MLEDTGTTRNIFLSLARTNVLSTFFPEVAVPQATRAKEPINSPASGLARNFHHVTKKRALEQGTKANTF